MGSYNRLRQLLSGYVCTYIQPDTTELQQCIQAVTSEQRYELVTEVRGLLGTAMHIAALQDHTEIISCILDSFTAEVRYKLLKVQRDKTGRTAIHIVAYNDHTVIHMALLNGKIAAMGCMPDKVSPERQIQLPHFCSSSAGRAALILQYIIKVGHTSALVTILDSVSAVQLHDPLMLQQDQDGYTAIALFENGGNTKTAEHLRTTLAQQLDQSDETIEEADASELTHVENETRRSNKYSHNRSADCLRCKEFKESTEEIESKYAVQSVTLVERDQLLETCALQIKQLTNQVTNSDERGTQLANQLAEQCKQISQLTTQADEQKQQIAEQKQQIAEQKQQIAKLTNENEGQCRKYSVLAAKTEGHDVQLQQQDVKISEMNGEISQVKQQTQKLEANVQKAAEDIPVLGTKTEDHGAQLQQHDVNISALQQQEMEQNTQIKANTEGISKNSDDILQQNNLFQKKPDQPLELTEDGCINPEQEGDSPPTPTGEEVEEEDIDRGMQEIVN